MLWQMAKNWIDPTDNYNKQTNEYNVQHLLLSNPFPEYGKRTFSIIA